MPLVLLEPGAAARDVRRRWPWLPIILTSGVADPVAPERDVPGVMLLHKPLEPVTLLAASSGHGRR